MRDISPGARNTSPSYLTNVNGMLYFRADDGNSGSELWKSDGTSAGTVSVRDIRLGANGAYPGSLANVNGMLYFQPTMGAGVVSYGRVTALTEGRSYCGTYARAPAVLTRVIWRT